MTHLIAELQQHAALQVEVAFEAGYDAAAEPAYNAGFDDGLEKGREDGFREAVQIIETTRNGFDDSAVTGEVRFDDAGDECDCGCQDEEAVLNIVLPLTGDYDDDLETLVAGLSIMSDKIFSTEDSLLRALDLLEASVAASVELARQVAQLQVQVGSLERDADLAEADALLLDTLADRVADLEAHAGILV